MTFEPACLHQHVLNFYRTTGTVGSSPDRVRLTLRGPHRVRGCGQYFEQSLYFLLGHLLPEYDPLNGELLVADSSLQLRYHLPNQADNRIDHLGLRISEDSRFQHLLDKVAASCILLVPDDDSNCYRIGLDFPLISPQGEGIEPAIDFQELVERFECSEIAEQMVEWFVTTAHKNVSSIRTSFRVMNWKEAHRQAHSLKGGALNVGARSFARTAKELELAIKEQQYQTVPEILKQLETACQELELFWNNHHGELYG